MGCVGIELEQVQCGACPEGLSATVGQCPGHRLFQHIGDKWTLPVLGTLYPGPLRFSQFRKTLPSLSERMLILTLSKLEDSGFIERGDSEALQNAYSLTPMGRSLLEHVGDLQLWMSENASAVLAACEAASLSEE